MSKRSLLKIQIAKKRQIRDAALEIFRKFGFKRVSVEELCERASVSKATFYKYYTNKIELVAEMLKESYDQSYNVFTDLIASKSSTEQIVSEIFTVKLDFVEYWGDAFVTDLMNSDDELDKLMKDVLQKFNTLFKDILLRAQDRGEITKGLKPEVILLLTTKFHDWIKDEGLQSLFKDKSEMIRELNNFFFYGIMGKRE